MLVLDIAAASRSKPGEADCGDQISIVREGHRSLVVVADGLGHGPDAAAAARAAVSCVVAAPWADLTAMLRECARALAGSRGAALTLLRVDTEHRTLVYAGVGNLELLALSHLPVGPINAQGIVGGRFRSLNPSLHTISDGDLVVLHTDGLSSRMDLAQYRDRDAATIADALIRSMAKAHDDASCVVLRFSEAAGQAPEDGSHDTEIRHTEITRKDRIPPPW